MSTKVYLDVVSPESSVRRITLEGSITVGRAKGCKLRIPSRAISREHCRIELGDGPVRITDLDSSNGTFIDGTRLEAHEAAELPAGSLLKIGNRKFKVRIQSDDGLDQTIIDQNLATDTMIAAARGAGLGDTLIDELPPQEELEELAVKVPASADVDDDSSDDFSSLLEQAESVDTDGDFELAAEDDSAMDFFDEDAPAALLDAVADVVAEDESPLEDHTEPGSDDPDEPEGFDGFDDGDEDPELPDGPDSADTAESADRVEAEVAPELIETGVVESEVDTLETLPIDAPNQTGSDSEEAVLAEEVAEPAPAVEEAEDVAQNAIEDTSDSVAVIEQEAEVAEESPNEAIEASAGAESEADETADDVASAEGSEVEIEDVDPVIEIDSFAVEVEVESDDQSDPVVADIETDATGTESADVIETAETEAGAEPDVVDVGCEGVQPNQPPTDAAVDSYSDLVDDADDFGAGLMEEEASFFDVDDEPGNTAEPVQIDAAEVVQHFAGNAETAEADPGAADLDSEDIAALDAEDVSELEDANIVDAELAEALDAENSYEDEPIPVAEFADEGELELDEEFDSDDDVFVAELADEDDAESALDMDDAPAAADRSVVVAELEDDSLVVAAVVEEEVGDVPDAIPVTDEDSDYSAVPAQDDFELMNFEESADAEGSVSGPEADEASLAVAEATEGLAGSGRDAEPRRRKGLFGWLRKGKQQPGHLDDNAELSGDGPADFDSDSDDTVVLSPDVERVEEPETVVMHADELLAGDEELSAVDRSQFVDEPDETVRMSADDIAAAMLDGDETIVDAPSDVDLDDFFKGVD